MTATDEADLARRLERAEQENAEIDGDEDEDEEGMSFGNGTEQSAGKESAEEDEEDVE